MEENVKLGIKGTILAVAIFASGATTPIIMVGLILYTLLFEENAFARTSAQRAIYMYVVFAMLQGIFDAWGYVNYIFSNTTGYNVVFNKISSIFGLIEVLCFLFMAIHTWVFQGMNPTVLQKVLDKFSQIVQKSKNKIPPNELERGGVFCSKCGNRIANSAHFCDKCGEKINAD